MMTEQIDFENRMVLAAVSAFIGCITPQMRAIAIATDHLNEVVDLFIAATEPLDDPELISEVELDMDVAGEGRVLTRTHVWIGSDWVTDWPERHRRLIFAARP